MASGHELGDLVDARASLLPRRSWRFLLAHDATAPTCKPLMQSVERALGKVDIVASASVEHALAELRDSTFDACFVCLDLPPVPAGGARLAQKMVRDRFPVVLVTRSLRWLPQSAANLREVPWVPPDAPPNEVAKAVRAALAEAAIEIPAVLEAAERADVAVAGASRR
jgi:DNA-binding NarL/FixJ family response regulator